jgi:DNA-binding NtrC family response regulator
VALCRGTVLGLDDVRLSAHAIARPQASEPALPGLEPGFEEQPLKALRQRVVDALEKAYLTRLMKKYDGDVERIAKIAELHPVSVRRLLKEHGVEEEPR